MKTEHRGKSGQNASGWCTAFIYCFCISYTMVIVSIFIVREESYQILINGVDFVSAKLYQMLILIASLMLGLLTGNALLLSFALVLSSTQALLKRGIYEETYLEGIIVFIKDLAVKERQYVKLFIEKIFGTVDGQTDSETEIPIVQPCISDDKEDDTKQTEMESCITHCEKENEGDHIEKDHTIETFGKNVVLPVRTLNVIASVSGSIGRLSCGEVSATCWLLTEDTIITCQHVFFAIHELRRVKTVELYEVIYVDFEYEKRLSSSHVQREIDESKPPVCCSHELDYIICYLKPILSESSEIVTDLPSLGMLTRSVAPQKGQVILVGHPEGNYKRFQMCRIIPRHDRLEILQERMQEAVNFCCHYPRQCRQVIGPVASCVHDYSHLTKLEHVNFGEELAFDTSFYHGSDGSPVFNEDGHIIAMHNRGYRYNKGFGKESLMEFAVSISFIYEDVRMKQGESIAKKLFQNC